MGVRLDQFPYRVPKVRRGNLACRQSLSPIIALIFQLIGPERETLTLATARTTSGADAKTGDSSTVS